MRGLIIPLLFGVMHSAFALKNGVVVSENKVAAQIGADILKKGGNAFDAAAATGYAFGVVEPHSGGIGGGGFALIYQAKTGKVHAIDFRERAPENIQNILKTASQDFKTGPKAGGVMGTVAGFQYLRERFGTMTAQDVITPSIRLAKEGFIANDSFELSYKFAADKIKQFPSSLQVLGVKDDVVKPGDFLQQPDLAKTLQQLIDEGEQSFYHGKLADKITSNLQNFGGIITSEDMQNYKVYDRVPVCGNFKEHKVCSMPYPSSGGNAIIQALNIIEHLEMPKSNSTERHHIIIEVLKQIFADRAKQAFDQSLLTSKEYAKDLSKRILNRSKVDLNHPAPHPQGTDTTHFTVVDKKGNIVAVTFSLNGLYGSKFVIPNTGIILNNTLDDFSIPGELNIYGLVASSFNLAEPGKTPLSSMSPTIVFDGKDRPMIALGSPGGPTIISAVLQTLVYRLVDGINLQSSINKGRLHHQWKPDSYFFDRDLLSDDQINKLSDEYEHKHNKTRQSYWTVEAVEINQDTGNVIGASDNRTEQGISYSD